MSQKYGLHSKVSRFVPSKVLAKLRELLYRAVFVCFQPEYFPMFCCM